MTDQKLKEYWKKAKGNGYPINYIDSATDTEIIFQVTGPRKAFISFQGATSIIDFVLAIFGGTKRKFERVYPWIEEQLAENNIKELESIDYSQGASTAAYLYKKLYGSHIELNFIFFAGYKTINVPVTNITYKNDFVPLWPLWKKKTYKNYYIKSKEKIPWWRFKKIHEQYRKDFEEDNQK